MGARLLAKLLSQPGVLDAQQLIHGRPGRPVGLALSLGVGGVAPGHAGGAEPTAATAGTERGRVGQPETNGWGIDVVAEQRKTCATIALAS